MKVHRDCIGCMEFRVEGSGYHDAEPNGEEENKMEPRVMEG